MGDFLIAIIVTWVLFRLFRPVVFVHWNKPQQYQNNSSPNQSQAPEGEITVNKTSVRNKNIPDGAGEYVDFEELPNNKS
jgi:hypothetical protein